MDTTEANVTRVEELRITLKFDAERAKAHRLAFAELMPRVNLLLSEGDKLHYDWTCCLHYLGDTDRHLAAILEILEDPGVVFEADLEELRHGQSVLLALALKLEDLIEKGAVR